MREWDPIGVRDVAEAQDEYDAYVGKAYVVLVDEAATVDEMERYLLSVENHMGFTSSMRGAERCRRAAEALVALRPALLVTH